MDGGILSLRLTHTCVMYLSEVAMKSPVYRFEAAGEAGIPYPTIAQATSVAPTNAECRIATSPEGVVLAEACPVRGTGTVLVWVLTNPGRDVVAVHGWTDRAPRLSDLEADTVLQHALAADLRGAA